jgi:putative PIN family toxin of toxin-antitoxin system
MRHLAYTEINNHTIPFSLSNSTSKVAHFLTTIFGSIYHDREEELLVLIEERSDPVLLSGDVTICRDSGDNMVIETAVKGRAEYLVTRD